MSAVLCQKILQLPLKSQVFKVRSLSLSLVTRSWRKFFARVKILATKPPWREKSVKAYAPHSPKGFTALCQNFARANDPAGYAGLLRVDFHCRVIFKWHANTCKIEVLYGRSRVNVKVEPRPTFTFSRGKSYITTIFFTHAKISRQWKSTVIH